MRRDDLWWAPTHFPLQERGRGESNIDGRERIHGVTLDSTAKLTVSLDEILAAAASFRIETHEVTANDLDVLRLVFRSDVESVADNKSSVNVVLVIDNLNSCRSRESAG